MINQESKSRLVLSKNAVWIFTTWREGGTCKETLSLINLIYTECIFQLSDSDTVFENHSKSRIQHCERSELRLHFEWTKVHQKYQKMVQFDEFLTN